MRKTAPRCIESADGLTPVELRRHADGWLLDCEIRQHSRRTIDTRRDIVGKLLWFLGYQEAETCGTLELRRFLAYIGNGHHEPGGRWNNPHQNRPVRPRTVRDYHGHLRTLFRWLVDEGAIESSPMETIAAPISRADQVQPFTPEQVDALLRASERGVHPRRDKAILLFMLDSAVRASELCALTVADVDLQSRRALVLGKGNKRRYVYFSGPTTKALYQYLTEEDRDPADPFFASDRGTRAGEALTRSGLLQLFDRLGRAAGIEAVRCSPHTMRHTSCVEFLRAGGNQFSLMQMLGHTQVQMTARYVQLAAADVQEAHRRCSPVERLQGRRSR